MDIALRAFLRVPVVGWLVKDAIYGLPDAKYYFTANVVIMFSAAIYHFGYPFVIIYALTATASAFSFLVILTASDLFQRPKKPGGSDH